MKLKKIVVCVLAAVLTVSSVLPLHVEASSSKWKKSVDTISDKTKIKRYEKELGKMDVTVKSINLTQAQSASITKFDVNWKAGAVYVMPINGSSIKITQKSYYSQSKDQQVTYTLNNGTLKIQDARKKIELFKTIQGEYTIQTSPIITSLQWFANQKDNDAFLKKFFSYCKKTLFDLIIQVPQKQYESFEFNSEYASCSIKDMKVKNMESDSTSGIVQYEGCTFRDVSGETVNGSINLIKSSAKEVDIEAVNGELWLEDTAADKAKLDVINGSILVNKKFPDGECKLTAINGNIYVMPEQFPSGFSKEFKASVVNGDIKVILPANTGFYIPKKNKGINGGIKSDFTLKKTKSNYIYGDGKVILNVSCSNGDIAIYKTDK